MTAKDWLTTLVPSVVAVLAAYWQIEAMRAIADPGHRPFQRLKRAGMRAFQIAGYVVPLVALAYTLRNLIVAATDPRPFTKQSVLLIALLSAIAAFQFTVFIATMGFLYILRDIGKRLREIDRDVANLRHDMR